MDAAMAIFPRRGQSIVVGATLALFLAAGCAADDLQSSNPDGGNDGLAAWTVFIYGNGDNNLANGLLADMKEMRDATIAPGLQVVVLVDLDASQTDVMDQPLTPGYALLRVVGGGKDFVKVEEGPEISLTDADILKVMTTKVFRQFPARHRAVVMWDHGGSWSGGFGPDEQDGSDDAGRTLTMTQIVPALKQGLQAAGASGDRPLDVFAFDTCLMGTAEVATEAAAVARVFIADAEIDYGNGWDYTKTLSWLSDHPEATPQDFARAEVGIWDEHHKAATFDDRLLRSHIALDLERWDPVLAAATRFTEAATANPRLMARPAFLNLPSYTSGVEDPEQNPTLRDLGRFAALVGDDSIMGAPAVAFNKALAAATLGTSMGMLRQQANQSGLQVALPIGKSYDEIASDYAAAAPRWNAASGWSKMLAASSAAADVSPPGVRTQVVGSTKLQFSTDSSDVGSGAAYLMSMARGQTALMMPLGTGLLEPKSQYEVEWDGKWLVLDDADQAPLGVRPWYALPSAGPSLDDSSIFAIMLDLDTVDDGIVRVAFLSTDGSEPATDATPEADNDVATLLIVLGDEPAAISIDELFAAYGPKISATPVFALQSSTGLQLKPAGKPFPLSSKGLPIKLKAAPSGRYAFLTSVKDIWGNATQDVQPIDHTADQAAP